MLTGRSLFSWIFLLRPLFFLQKKTLLFFVLMDGLTQEQILSFFFFFPFVNFLIFRSFLGGKEGFGFGFEERGEIQFIIGTYFDLAGPFVCLPIKQWRIYRKGEQGKRTFIYLFGVIGNSASHRIASHV